MADNICIKPFTATGTLTEKDSVDVLKELAKNDKKITEE